MAGVDVSIPPAFFELESERDACRTQGAYHEAGVAQRRLERAKREHEQQRLQVGGLADGPSPCLALCACVQQRAACASA